MTTTRWMRVEQMFHQIFELPLSEQAAAIERLCGNDSELRAEIESLLAHCDECDSRIPGIILAAGLELPTSPPSSTGPEDSRVGEIVGRYRLTRLIDVGGMGAVYEARRADKAYEQRVCVKLIRPGSFSRESMRRFLRERQVLAGLDHPHIARLLDGGTAHNGQPFLVMEFIDGEPIDDWCDHNRLTVRERLSLFQIVCSAVQYIHQNLIVHQDIKPANILITRQGQPKLLDFGIAKILEAEGFPTATTRAYLTPVYASPEQLLNASITTATDIYSLGTVLYSILVGQTPFPNLSSSPHQLAQHICTSEAVKPSAVLDQLAEVDPRKALEVSACRGCSPETLTRALRGDVDNIVLCAMSKEPNNRYSTAEQFLQDIGRHLTGFPIQAHAYSFFDRAIKFFRRNQALTAVAALFVLALLVGSLTTLHQADKAERRAEANRRAGLALLDFYRSFEPFGQDRSVLDAQARSIVGELGDEASARILFTEGIAGIWERAQMHELAVAWRSDALKIHERSSEWNERARAKARYSLGHAYLEAGQFSNAEATFRELLDRADRLEASDSLLLSQVERDLARTLSAIWHESSPRGLFDRALNRQKALFQEHGSTQNAVEFQAEWLRTKAALAAHLVERGESSEAIEILEQAVKEVDSLAIEDPRLRATLQRQLGQALWLSPRFSEAETHLRAAIATLYTTPEISPADPIVQWTRLALTGCLRERGARYPANAILRESLGEIETWYAEDSLELAEVCLAWIHDKSDNLNLVQYADRATDIFRKRLGPRHPKVAEAMVAAGGVDVRRWHESTYEDHKKFLHRGRETLSQALALQRAVLPLGHWKTARTASWLAEAHLKMERYGDLGTQTTIELFQEADDLLNEAVSGLSQVLGPSHPWTHHALQLALQLYISSGKTNRAAAIREQLKSNQRPWPYDMAIGFLASKPEDWFAIDYDDDFVERTVFLDDLPAEILSARLWVYAQPYNYPGHSPKKADCFQLLVNGDLRQRVAFDINLVAGQTATTNYGSSLSKDFRFFHWIPIEFDPRWLRAGANTFLIYEDDGYASEFRFPPEWEYNNVRIGMVHSQDHQRSWWHTNLRSDDGFAMARFLNDQLGLAEVDGILNRIPVEEMWSRTLETTSPIEMERARREAAENCNGELMIFLEIVPKS